MSNTLPHQAEDFFYTFYVLPFCLKGLLPISFLFLNCNHGCFSYYIYLSPDFCHCIDGCIYLRVWGGNDSNLPIRRAIPHISSQQVDFLSHSIFFFSPHCRWPRGTLVGPSVICHTCHIASPTRCTTSFTSYLYADEKLAC